MSNPFNANQISRISLAQEDVDAFVFWSKNPKPMLDLLPELNDRGFIFYFQFTLNHYPCAMEPSIPDVEDRLESFHQLSQKLGPDRVVWRYDPIIITPTTNYDFHASAFERLAASLRGATRRVVVSVVNLYRKTDRRMSYLEKDDFEMDPDAANDPQMFQLLSHISRVAREVGMDSFSCAEEKDFSLAGVRPGSCVDCELITSLGGHVSAKKDPGQRATCRCVISRDIGINDTCLHGCPYCYATRDNRFARQRHTKHDPNSPILFGPAELFHPARTAQRKMPFRKRDLE